MWDFIQFAGKSLLVVYMAEEAELRGGESLLAFDVKWDNCCRFPWSKLKTDQILQTHQQYIYLSGIEMPLIEVEKMCKFRFLT